MEARINKAVFKRICPSPTLCNKHVQGRKSRFLAQGYMQKGRVEGSRLHVRREGSIFTCRCITSLYSDVPSARRQPLNRRNARCLPHMRLIQCSNAHSERRLSVSQWRVSAFWRSTLYSTYTRWRLFSSRRKSKDNSGDLLGDLAFCFAWQASMMLSKLLREAMREGSAPCIFLSTPVWTLHACL